MFTRTFKLEFTYLSKLFKTTVLEADYPNGCRLYKLKLNTNKCWLLKDNKEWKVLGDVTLGQNLKELLISEIERSSSVYSRVA